MPSIPGSIRIGRLILFGLLVAGLASTARAQTCTFTFSAVTFGNVDVTTGGTYDTTGTFQASCSGWTPLATSAPARISAPVPAGPG